MPCIAACLPYLHQPRRSKNHSLEFHFFMVQTHCNASLQISAFDYFSFKLIRIFFSSSTTVSLKIASVSIRSCTVLQE